MGGFVPLGPGSHLLRVCLEDRLVKRPGWGGVPQEGTRPRCPPSAFSPLSSNLEGPGQALGVEGEGRVWNGASTFILFWGAGWYVRPSGALGLFLARCPLGISPGPVL